MHSAAATTTDLGESVLVRHVDAIARHNADDAVGLLQPSDAGDLRHRRCPLSGVTVIRLTTLLHVQVCVLVYISQSIHSFCITVSDLVHFHICLFAWGLTALSAQIGYIWPQQ